MGGIVNVSRYQLFDISLSLIFLQRMTQQIISGVVLPTDRSKAWNLDYNVEVPDEDEEPGIQKVKYQLIY